jgi:hypothetical protein
MLVWFRGERPMTEAEWLACGGPEAMLYSLERFRLHPTERKCRLCSVAFCLRLKPSLLHEPARFALEVALRFADGVATEDERFAAGQAVAQVGAGSALYHAIGLDQTIDDVVYAAEAAQFGLLSVAEEQAIQVGILRDIFGNPFRPVAFSPDWRTDTVVSLARKMYESREFGAMPILADALQDAGCDSDDILSHCRDTSLTHVRGCWVVDLVLGKQ